MSVVSRSLVFIYMIIKILKLNVRLVCISYWQNYDKSMKIFLHIDTVSASRMKKYQWRVDDFWPVCAYRPSERNNTVKTREIYDLKR